jgi:hypothetical protein
MKATMTEKIINYLHGILSHFAEMENDKFDDFRTEIKERFGFEKDFGWNILLNSIFIIQDTELAKESFKEFDLQGPCRHIDIGERYLRLYGLLNSINLQRIAIINLVEIFKIQNKKEIIECFQKLKIIELRHKVAAHSSDFKHTEDNAENDYFVYEISRYELKQDKVRLCLNQKSFEFYDLKKEIENFESFSNNILMEINRKLIKKIFNNQGKYYDDFQLLEEEYKGNLVFKLPNGDNTIVRFK